MIFHLRVEEGFDHGRRAAADAVGNVLDAADRVITVHGACACIWLKKLSIFLKLWNCVVCFIKRRRHTILGDAGDHDAGEEGEEAAVVEVACEHLRDEVDRHLRAIVELVARHARLQNIWKINYILQGF